MTIVEAARRAYRDDFAGTQHAACFDQRLSGIGQVVEHPYRCRAVERSIVERKGQRIRAYGRSRCLVDVVGTVGDDGPDVGLGLQFREIPIAAADVEDASAAMRGRQPGDV